MQIEVLYFSGTGNTAHVASRVAQLLEHEHHHAQTHSIESFRKETPIDQVFFPLDSTTQQAITQADYVIIAYPIYGSVAPRIVREFVTTNRETFRGKRCAIIVTQAMFSGDGGAFLARIIRPFGAEVVAIEHIAMPSNLPGFPFLPIKNGSALLPTLQKADIQIARFVARFKESSFRRTGDNLLGRLLGLTQSVIFLQGEKKLTHALRIDALKCTGCGLCITECPMGNLYLNDTPIATQRGNCTLCYRCINLCPTKAMNLIFLKPLREQYHGILKLSASKET